MKALLLVFSPVSKLDLASFGGSVESNAQALLDSAQLESNHLDIAPGACDHANSLPALWTTTTAREAEARTQVTCERFSYLLKPS